MVYGDKDNFAGLIKDINKVLKRGKIRGDQEYDFGSCYAVNCMGHAFFNFKNNDINDLSAHYKSELHYYFWMFDRFDMFHYYTSPRRLCKQTEKDLIEKIKKSSLKMEECKENDELERGQWKVAYFFSFEPGREDFHFMRQEEDGEWSSKAGSSMKVEKFKKLPKKYNNYRLIKIFKVTNPYIVAENDRLDEERE